MSHDPDEELQQMIREATDEIVREKGRALEFRSRGNCDRCGRTEVHVVRVNHMHVQLSECAPGEGCHANEAKAPSARFVEWIAKAEGSADMFEKLAVEVETDANGCAAFLRALAAEIKARMGR